jgi:hypothetical protein
MTKENTLSLSKQSDVKTFTYVGAGEGSPNVIKFMGKIDMVRGEPVDVPVSDSHLIGKLLGCSTIIEGAIVDRKDLQEMDIKAKNKADKQRAEDRVTNQKAMKLLGKAKE